MVDFSEIRFNSEGILLACPYQLPADKEGEFPKKVVLEARARPGKEAFSTAERRDVEGVKGVKGVVEKNRFKGVDTAYLRKCTGGDQGRALLASVAQLCDNVTDILADSETSKVRLEPKNDHTLEARFTVTGLEGKTTLAEIDFEISSKSWDPFAKAQCDKVAITVDDATVVVTAGFVDASRSIEGNALVGSAKALMDACETTVNNPDLLQDGGYNAGGITFVGGGFP